MGRHAFKNIRMNWPPAPEQWPPGDGEVRVWAANLRQTPERIAAHARTLSQDELARANHFHFDHDRSRFISGRGMLRVILGRCLGREPGQLKFVYTARGKPALAGVDGCNFYFNASHSEDLLLVAVTRLCPPGIDVERLRLIYNIDGIASRFFSRRESEGLNTLPTPRKANAFFNLWTRKEAWLKATGEGISDSLNQVEPTFLPGEPARFTALFGDSEAAQDWSLRGLIPASGYVAALAIPARNARVSCHVWSEGRRPGPIWEDV